MSARKQLSRELAVLPGTVAQDLAGQEWEEPRELSLEEREAR